MMYDNLSLEFTSRHSKISLGKSYNKLRNSSVVDLRET